MTGSDQSCAIFAACDACQSIVVKSIQIDGARDKLGWVAGGLALLEMGGNTKGQVSSPCDVSLFRCRIAHDTRLPPDRSRLSPLRTPRLVDPPRYRCVTPFVLFFFFRSRCACAETDNFRSLFRGIPEPVPRYGRQEQPDRSLGIRAQQRRPVQEASNHRLVGERRSR